MTRTSGTTAVAVVESKRVRRSGRRGVRGLLPTPTVAIFLLLAGIYLLTSGGHTYSYDEETMFGLTYNIVERGSIVVPICPDCPILTSTPGPLEQNYSRYGPLQSLLAIPPYLIGRALASGDDAAIWFGTRFAATLLTALVAAAIGALLYRLARDLGYAHGTALATALLYGLATQAWPRAKTFFADPLTTLLILGAVYCWWRLDRGEVRGTKGEGRTKTGMVRWGAGLALCCGLAVTTKYGAGIILPFFGVAGAASLWRHWRGGLAVREVVRVAGAAVVALAVPLLALGAYNWVRYGTLLETGYSEGEVGAVQQGDWREGLGGLLISPGKGLVFFSPIVVLGLLAYWPFARRHPRLAALSAALTVAHVAFYARVPNWDGGTCWGPRYLDFIVPLLVLPVAAGIAWARERGRGARLALGGLALPIVALALAVQLLGVLVNFNSGFDAVQTGSRYWDAANAPPLVHAGLLRERIGAWWAIRFPSQAAIIPERGLPEVNEQDPLWPRYLPQEATLRVHAPGNGPLTGTLVYDDAREVQEPPARFAVLANGQPLTLSDAIPAPNIGPNAYRLTFTLREAGAGGEDFTLTIRNEQFAALGPSYTHTVAVAGVGPTDGSEELPTLRRPLLLPFPVTHGERWAWFYTLRNQHLVDLWPWYLAVARLPESFAAILFVGVGGGATLALVVGIAGVWARREATDSASGKTRTKTDASLRSA